MNLSEMTENELLHSKVAIEKELKSRKIARGDRVYIRNLFIEGILESPGNYQYVNDMYLDFKKHYSVIDKNQFYSILAKAGAIRTVHSYEAVSSLVYLESYYIQPNGMSKRLCVPRTLVEKVN